MNMMDNLGDGFHIHNTYDERYVAIFPPEHQLGALNAIKLSNLSGEPYVDRLAYEMREMVGDVCKYKGPNSMPVPVRAGN